MNLRVRGPSGQASLKLEPSCSLAEFRALLADRTGVPAERQEVRGGFPPKLLAFPADEAAATVASLGLQSGDSLTVSQLPAGGAAAAASPPSNGHQVAAEGAPAPAAGVGGLSEDEQLARAIALSLGQAVPDLPPPAAASGGAAGLRAATAAATAPAAASARVAAPQRRAASPVRAHPASSAPSAAAAKQQQGAPIAVPLPDGTAVMRRIVDSDNSCLFNAIGYVTERSRKRAPLLRQVIADAVLADPFEWNEAVLGKEPAEYCRWIKDPTKWGGAIELSILSQHLRREVAAFDIQTTRVDIYGQGAGYSERVMVIYDGLHYDALAVAAFEGAPEQLDAISIPTSGPRTDMVMQGAQQLAAKAHAARALTDTTNFTLRCGVCQIGLKGEKEAVEHAKLTGHSNFAEF